MIALHSTLAAPALSSTVSATSPASSEFRSSDPSIEASLVAAAQGGDERAFGVLVHRHQRKVYRLCGRFFRRPQDVDDAAQETFLLVWRKLASFRGESPFEHWVTRVCCNLCYQRLRRQRPETVDLDAIEPPQAPEHDPSAAHDVSRLLLRLDPRDRFVLLLLDGEGWSTAEIAERLGWTRVNVKVRAHRARKRLMRLATSLESASGSRPKKGTL